MIIKPNAVSMYRIIPVLLLLFILAQAGISAQHLQGYAMSNYAGTGILYHNPAFVADSRYALYVNAAGLNFHIGNNHVKWDAPFSFTRYITNSVPDEYRHESGAVRFPRTYLAQRLNGNQKYLNAGLELLLPSLMVSLKDGRFGVALSSRVRSVLSLRQTTEPLARLIRGSVQDSTLHGVMYDDQSTKLQLDGVGEYAVTFGGVLLDNDVDFIKVGLTAKRLIGISHYHIHLDHARYELIPDPEWDNRRYMIATRQLDGSGGFTSDEGIRSISLNPNYWLTGQSAPGSGWAFDIGAVYEYRPDIKKYSSYNGGGPRTRDGRQNKYLYRLAVSLTDIGWLGFKNTYYNRSLTASNAVGMLDYNSFQRLSGADEFFSTVENRLRLAASEPASFKTSLPMALQASADYQVRPGLYVNTLWVQNLASARPLGIKKENLLALTPRYEHRWYEISMPLSLMNQYRSFGIGLAGRIGPLWMGTDHLTGLFNLGKPKAVTFYAGLSMGVFRRGPDEQLPCWPPKQNWFRRLFQKEK